MAVSLVSTGVQFPDNSTQITAATGFGFKNRIINGGMVIDQRNAGASVTINSTGDTYTVDRWAAAGQITDGVYTAQQSTTAPSGFTNSLLATVTTADASIGSTQSYLLTQFIEGLNASDLAWGTASASPVTLSFWVRSSLTGTFGGCLQNSANDRSYPFSFTINSANTYEQKTITIVGDTTGTWLTDTGRGINVRFSLGVGSSYKTTAGAWAAGNYFAPTGSVDFISTLSATFYITGVQLEKGSTATSFDYRPYGTELALCQRYYWRLKANNTVTNFCTGLNTSATTARHMVTFPVTMRTAPAAVEQSGTASDYRLWHASGTTTNLSAVPAFDNANEFTANLSLTVASGLTGGGFSILIANAGVSGYLGWSAEL